VKSCRGAQMTDSQCDMASWDQPLTGLPDGFTGSGLPAGQVAIGEGLRKALDAIVHESLPEDIARALAQLDAETTGRSTAGPIPT
jgi:hypothetical protein